MLLPSTKYSVTEPLLLGSCVVATLLPLLLLFKLIPRRHDDIPYINPPPVLDLFGQKTKKHFTSNAGKLMKSGRKLFRGKPYRMFTDLGELVVLPSKYIDDFRNEPGLSFMTAFIDNFHPSLPGFEGFAFDGRPDELLHRTINKRLTKLLNQITSPLAAEANFATNLVLGKSNKWQEILLKDATLELVARLSSRVFLGEELCRNQQWLDISKSYSINIFLCGELLRQYPHFLRHAACYFIPECQLLRKQVADARKLMTPILQKRRDERRIAETNGKPAPVYNDVMQWVEEESKGSSYDPVGAQLGFSVVAMHTTTDLATETMCRLIQRPQLVQDLREEIESVLVKEGWTKTALFQMKLLDSVLKEAQRLKPTTSATMNRTAIKRVTLPSGLVLEEGDRCMADLGSMVDPEVYENPEVFDGYRYLRMREDPKLESKAHLVSTSSIHLGFGHGKHACPGRFFASNEVKVLLCHLLYKYDWKIDGPYEHTIREFGISLSSGDGLKVSFRRRENLAVDIDNL
ncbi:Cytochrome P450 monooxygenase eqxH [Colletotrichum siamense]|uniref:Cytochrome P450 monooxygenase eqxH n=1 Tax=Colletotrichum siamense TaxID=690259 RepID=A0A9P5K9A4_COLSI|nr:Cytochrome P450 monooxygenase eqxH [Colletotrichum siamense]KAF4866664.1 Cytochrome P450 monooxygenase eqxH [Colletotrichum siamense]